MDLMGEEGLLEQKVVEGDLLEHYVVRRGFAGAALSVCLFVCFFKFWPGSPAPQSRKAVSYTCSCRRFESGVMLFHSMTVTFSPNWAMYIGVTKMSIYV